MAKGDVSNTQEIADMWEEILLVKATVEEWPHGPCAAQMEKIAKHFKEGLARHEKGVHDNLQAMNENIALIRQEVFTTKNRALETQKQAMAAVNSTNDYLKEYDSRIRMLQDAHKKMADMWNSVLETIGYKLEYVPAKFEVTKVADQG